MKNKLFRKLSVLALALALVFSLTACVPDIHIHMGEDKKEAESVQEATSEKTEAPLEEKAPAEEEAEKPATSSKEESSKKPTTSKESATSSKTQSSAKISKSEAKKIALSDAGVKESQIYDFENELDYDNGALHYDISFEKDGKDYDYEIDAKSGKILSVEKPRTTSKKPASSDTSSKSSTSSKPSTSNISKSKAKSIALKDAGVKESQIYDYEIELDNDRGVLHYDVSFEKDGKDYDYEIDAKSGKILSVEKPKATASKSQISASKAKSIALSDAGVKAADIFGFQSELEKDDGVWKYEISFQKGNVEYDYTISAENGKILEKEKDIDD